MFDAITDVPGITVGHWTNRRAATGCTVVLCGPEGAVGGVDVRGPAPGTRETDLLRPGNLVDRVHAVLLTGGSAFGLDAAGGVMRYLEEHGIGFRTRHGPVPIVVGAVIYDLGIGRADVRPSSREGYRACLAASAGPVQQGSVGAGTGATVAKVGGPQSMLKGGLGSASEWLTSGIVVGALVVVNAVGEVIDPYSGRVVAGPRAETGGFESTIELLRGGRSQRTPIGTSTTLGVVATNAALDKAQANRLATVAHDGLARAIRPAHTLGDGDTIFALATGELSLSPSQHSALQALAVQAVERAVLRAVLEARGLAGVPSAREWLRTSRQRRRK